jgi:excisionase family DNA binding protein
VATGTVQQSSNPAAGGGSGGSGPGTSGGSIATLDPDSDRLLTVPEVAEVLGVSPNLVYRFVALDPTFPVIRLGRLVRVREGALARWIRRGEDRTGRR